MISILLSTKQMTLVSDTNEFRHFLMQLRDVVQSYKRNEHIMKAN